MHRIALVCSKPNDPETAILQLSEEEHDQLHKDALSYVNDHNIFCMKVRSVDMPAHPNKKPVGKKGASPGWLVHIVHYPSCMCVGACMPAHES